MRRYVNIKTFSVTDLTQTPRSVATFTATPKDCAGWFWTAGPNNVRVEINSTATGTSFTTASQTMYTIPAGLRLENISAQASTGSTSAKIYGMLFYD